MQSVLMLYLPVSHGMQNARSVLPRYVPGAHTAQARSEVNVGFVDSYLPAAHTVVGKQ